MLFFPIVLLPKALNPIAILLIPVVLLYKAEFPIAVFPVPVAEELKFVVPPIDMFVVPFPPPLPKNKPLMVPFEPDVEIEPVTPREPVIIAFPVKGNPFVAKLELKAYEELITNEAVVAKLELKAYEELKANEAV